MHRWTMEEVIRLPQCRKACLLTNSCQDCPAFQYLVNEKLPLELANSENIRRQQGSNYRGFGSQLTAKL
jgi:hypothetical protein